MSSSSGPICHTGNLSSDHAAIGGFDVPCTLPMYYDALDLLSNSDFAIFGIALSTLMFVTVWCIQQYGPYIFVEAKSPMHRKKGNDRLLTKIHSKWYDLSTFEHPGGPVALSLIHKRDGTALFESHHPFIPREKLIKILAKYQVLKKDESVFGCELMDSNDGGHYVWEGMENDKFSTDVRALLHKYFGVIAKERGISMSEASKATPARWTVVIGLISSFFASLPYFVNGSWICLFLTPILSWVAAVNYWHDGLHFSLSTDWRVNAWLPYLFPYFSSPWMWYHEHVIGHHSYPNVDHKDPDLAHAPQLMREHNSIKWRPSHANQAQWQHVLFVWSVALSGLSLLNDAKANMKLSYNNVVPYQSMSHPRFAVHVMGRIGYIFLLHVWPYFKFPLWKAIIWSTVPGIIMSICFMVNTQINHLTNECSHASDKNFYKHQAKTAQNFGNNSLFCYYFSGGLNYQIEHHLFPNINHCHLPALAPHVKELCQKHNVPYHHVSGYREAIQTHFVHTKNMAHKPQ